MVGSVPYLPSEDVRAIRESIDHPIIDSDGHLVEYLPLVRDFLSRDAGESVAKAFDRVTHSALPRVSVPSPGRPAAAGHPRRRHLGTAGAQHAGPGDRHAAGAVVPAARRARHRFRRALSDVRLDGDGAAERRTALRVRPCAEPLLRRGLRRLPGPARAGRGNPDLHPRGGDRRAGSRGRGARTQDGHARRHDPAAVRRVSPARRTVPDAGSTRSATTRCTTTTRCGAGARSSASRRPSTPAGRAGAPACRPCNMSYNQVGNFAAADEGTCRSLVFGGVPMRFPQLRFAFQEGGVAWAAALLAGIAGHWEKRNAEAIQAYNPAYLDRARNCGSCSKSTRRRRSPAGWTGSTRACACCPIRTSCRRTRTCSASRC